MRITILLPTLNEEQSIGKTIASIPVEQLAGMGYEPEILIVDGGSTDRTVSLARAHGARVIDSRKGYGLQYRAGFESALGEIISTADSDFSYPMEQIPYLIDTLVRENLDFISTNRFAFMDSGSMPFINRFGNRFLTIVTNLLFSFRLKDSQSGMWIFRKSILEGLDLKSEGMSLSQEIKIKAFSSFKAKEVDSTYRKRVGRAKLRILTDGTGNLLHLFKFRLGLCK